MILSAAPGRQIKSYGPKCLLKLANGESLIDRHIRQINKYFKHNRIYCAAGFETSKIQKNVKGLREVFDIKHYETTNNLYSLGYALYKANIPDAFVLYGDTVYEDHFFENLIGGKISKVFTCNRSQGGVQCNTIDSRVNFMMWDIDKKFRHWSECAWFSKTACDNIKQLLKNRDTHRWFLFEGINHLSEKEYFKEVFINSSSIDIDKTSDIKKGNAIAGLL